MNTYPSRSELYDRLCAVLTDWENGEASPNDLYKTLVSVKNAWEELTVDDEQGVFC